MGLLIKISEVAVKCVVNIFKTCLVSEIRMEKERQGHYSSAILKIRKPHDVKTWFIVFVFCSRSD